MLKLARWLVGYITFRFSGGFAEGFINACFENRLNITNVRYEGDVLYADCPAALYKYLKPLAARCGGRTRVTSRRGAVFLLMPLKNRWGLLIGLVVCTALVGFLNGFVWEMNVTGCEQLTPQQVTDFLAENGFHEGVYWQSVDKDYLENMMLASFDECAWVHINRSGTTAMVEIGESVLKPAVQYVSAPANLLAAKDGVVVKATVYSGWQTVKAGEGVTRGDLLVSGVYESEKAKENMFVHARGEYIAEVTEPFSLTVSRTQQYKVYATVKEKKYLLFFGLEIPLAIDLSKPENAEITEVYDYFLVSGNRIPIGIKTKTVKPYTVQERQLTDSELEELLAQETQSKIDAEFSDAEILSKNIQTSLTEDAGVAEGTLRCLENIGEEVPLMQNENDAGLQEPVKLP